MNSVGKSTGRSWNIGPLFLPLRALGALAPGDFLEYTGPWVNLFFNFIDEETKGGGWGPDSGTGPKLHCEQPLGGDQTPGPPPPRVTLTSWS